MDKVSQTNSQEQGCSGLGSDKLQRDNQVGIMRNDRLSLKVKETDGLELDR